MRIGAIQPGELVLRDVHVPASPSWWPLAPGWWLLLAVIVIVAVTILLLIRARQRRRQQWQSLFDAATSLPGAGQRVAAISELLRRAARRIDVRADRLEGEDWLCFLDGDKGRDFSMGAGRLLLDGGYRREVDAVALAQLLPLARTRFLELMAKRR